jgi:phosphatidylinositol kinase/protein kinase (PI-3  family)
MPDPAMWLQARTTFMRTTAAWSMAGHIVGLGDRHCDNLLIDVRRGANVQIDFGHLFDSGRDLPYPEIVAFRLTQNMVDSFGVCGVEGGFRTTCCAGELSTRRVLAPLKQVHSLECLLAPP